MGVVVCVCGVVVCVCVCVCEGGGRWLEWCVWGGGVRVVCGAQLTGMYSSQGAKQRDHQLNPSPSNNDHVHTVSAFFTSIDLKLFIIQLLISTIEFKMIIIIAV